MLSAVAAIRLAAAFLAAFAGVLVGLLIGLIGDTIPISDRA